MDEPNVVPTILEECRQIHQQRSIDYGDEAFEDTAKITAILINRHFDAFEVAACFAAMKIVRYSYQVNSTQNHVAKDNAVTRDSIVDAINYLALTERERLKHVNKETVPPKARTGNELKNRSTTDELSNQLNDSFQAGFKEKDTGPSDKAVPKVPRPECASGHRGSTGMG